MPTFTAPSKARYTFARHGGAITHARLSIWANPGASNQKRIEVLHFEDSLDDDESFTRALPPGVYSGVLLVFVREDLNGVFAYEHRIDGTLVAKESGDVNQSSQSGEGLVNRHEFGLVLT
jgi:hypothetical protein